jgi:hypothetical protein
MHDQTGLDDKVLCVHGRDLDSEPRIGTTTFQPQRDEIPFSICSGPSGNG